MLKRKKGNIYTYICTYKRNCNACSVQVKRALRVKRCVTFSLESRTGEMEDGRGWGGKRRNQT